MFLVHLRNLMVLSSVSSVMMGERGRLLMKQWEQPSEQRSAKLTITEWSPWRGQLENALVLAASQTAHRREMQGSGSS